MVKQIKKFQKLISALGAIFTTIYFFGGCSSVSITLERPGKGLGKIHAQGSEEDELYREAFEEGIEFCKKESKLFRMTQSDSKHAGDDLRQSNNIVHEVDLFFYCE